jgi:hypothetical protein
MSQPITRPTHRGLATFVAEHARGGVADVFWRDGDGTEAVLVGEQLAAAAPGGRLRETRVNPATLVLGEAVRALLRGDVELQIDLLDEITRLGVQRDLLPREDLVDVRALVLKTRAMSRPAALRYLAALASDLDIHIRGRDAEHERFRAELTGYARDCLKAGKRAGTS